MAVKPRYDEAKVFRGGIAPVRQGNAWRYIDKAGKVIYEPKE
ncbi:MAG: WG repeat-containing protein [Candidatus Latescibacterota bacterium]